MSPRLEELQPAAVWRYFADLSRIPRCSKQEQAVGTWLEEVAAQHQTPVRRDAVGNTLIAIPARPGYEQAPALVIQNHVDMVCEKNAGVSHDFARDPIRPIVDGDWVRAEGTTLGADNGIGVALALALLDETETARGPVELLFTVDEETGLTGATAIEPGFFEARLMINLDSEEIGIFTVGCAGGRDAVLELAAPRQAPAADAAWLTVGVSGLLGGHSGQDIHRNRGNSIKLLARLLQAARLALGEAPLQLGRLSGGSKRNALPREATGQLVIPAGQAETVRAAIQAEQERLVEQFAATDAGLTITVGEPEADARGTVTDAATAQRLIALLNALPSGVQAMSPAMAGLVETSCNVGVLEDLGQSYRITCAGRSSLAPALDAVMAQIRGAADLAGVAATFHDGYPGWQPNLASPLLGRAKQVYADLFGKPAEVCAIHAGLECGLLTEKYPGLDIISYGPDIRGAHSPDERVRIETVERTWTFTLKLLENLALRGAQA